MRAIQVTQNFFPEQGTFQLVGPHSVGHDKVF